MNNNENNLNNSNSDRDNTNNANKDISTLSFEQAMSELAKITALLEKGEVDLDNAIKYYERANLLQVHCQNRLKDAQLRVESISQKNGNVNIEKAEDLEKMYNQNNINIDNKSKY